MMLLWIAAALAHVPHNDLQAVATDATVGNSLPWITLHEYGDATMVFRSDDTGLTWSPIGTQAASDVVSMAGWTDDEEIVLAGGSARFWWSSDLLGWSQAPLPSVPTGMAVGGNDLLFSGGDGLMMASTTGSVTELASGAGFLQPNFGPGGFSVLTEDGDIWYQRNGVDFVPVTPPFDATAAVWQGDVLYAGDLTGEVWAFSGGSWTVCGASPWPDATEPQIRQLVSDGGTLWFTTATDGPAMSTDSCASWQDRKSPLTSVYGGSGTAEGPEESSMGLRVSGPRLVHVGWSGLAFSSDSGQSWTEVMVLGPDFTRGIGISADYGNDGRMAFGTYAGGVVLSAGRGETWSAPNIDLEDPNVQDVEFSEQVGGPTLGVVNHFPWRSPDGGTTWESIDVPMYIVGAFHGTSDGRLWVTGLGGPAPVMVSNDNGATWDSVTGLTDIGDTFPLFTFHTTQNGSFCGTETEKVYCSNDDGVTWHVQYEGLGTVEGFAEYDDHWIIADDEVGVTVDGVLTLDGTDDPPHILAGTDDGHTVLVVTRSGELWRSGDGGLTWEDLGVRTTSPVRGLLSVPNYAFNHQFFLATYDGVFVLDDDGLRRFGGYQRIDAATDWVTSDGNTLATSSAAAFGTQVRLAVGGTLTTAIRGEQVRLVGSSDAASVGIITIDGGDPVEFGTATSGYGVLVEVTGLTDTWHQVAVEGVLGEGLYIDGIEGQTPTGVLPYATHGDTSDSDSDSDTDTDVDTDTGGDTEDTGTPEKRCGCADKNGSAALLLLLIAPLRRARRRT